MSDDQTADEEAEATEAEGPSEAADYASQVVYPSPEITGQAGGGEAAADDEAAAKE